MAKLYITHPLGAKEEVIYDTHATTVDWCMVTFEDSEGGQAEWTGPSVSVDLGDGSDPLDVYQDVSGESALGKYVIDASSWKIFGPDGPARVLSDAGPTVIDGVTWNPKQFQAVTPGRWLVKVQGQLIVQEEITGNGYNVASDSVSTFTALLEIEDPHVIGNIDGGHLETSSGSIGTSYMAPTEKVEYDADEGWARSAERYFSTVSKGMSFRKLASGVVATGSAAYGELMTVVSTEEYKRWRSSLVGIDLAGTERYYYNYNLQVRPVVAADLADEAVLAELPLFVSLGTALVNERVYLMVEGCLPYDTSVITTIDPATSRNTRLFVQPDGTLGPDKASDSGAYFDRYVGHVLSGNLPDDSTIPGGIYFHGHTTWLPGVLQGPLSSTDDAIVRWDGTTGELVKDSSIKIGHYADSPPLTPTDVYTNIAVAQITTVDHADPGDAGDTQLRITTEASDDRTAGLILIQPGDTNSALAAANVYVFGGEGVNGGGNVSIQSGSGSSPNPGTPSGDVHISTYSGIKTGDIEIVVGSASGSDVTDTPGQINIHAGSSSHLTGGTATLSAGSTSDLGGTGALGGDVVLTGGVGSSGGDVHIDGGANLGGAGLPGNTLISSAGTSGNTGIGGPAPDAGFAAMPTAILKVTGDSYFEGDLHISNKLTVDGIIDPIALILTADQKDMVVGLGGPTLDQDEGAIFVAKASDVAAVDHLGDPLVEGELYYKYAWGFDGIDEKVVSLSTGAGLSIPGPLAGSTFANAIARWSDDQGDTLENSKVLVDDANSHTLGAFFNEVSSLSTPETLTPSLKTDGGLQWQTSCPLLITTGEAGAGTGHASGSIEISPGVSDAPTNADVSIKSGESRVSGTSGGRLDLAAGDHGAIVSDFAFSGGDAFFSGGRNVSGTTPDSNDHTRRGRGGKTTIQGGDGNDGGAVEILGGSSVDGQTFQYAHGAGGGISLTGGSAGLDVTGTKASFVGGTTHVAVRGGDVTLTAGSTSEAPSQQTIKGASGGDITISGGSAGLGTGAPVDGTVAAPLHTVQESGGGAFTTESALTHKNTANHQFHGRGGSVVIEGGKGDHTGGSGGVLIQTHHTNEGWLAGPETVAGEDPNAGRGSIGEIAIRAADSLSRTGTGVSGGDIKIQAGSAGQLTAGLGGTFELRPGEPDWPLSGPVDHDGDPGTPDIQLVESGPDAQALVLGVLTDTPWPVDMAAVPPTMVGPQPGSVALDPDARGIVLVGTSQFHPSDHLCLGATVPRMVVDGDLVCTGTVDPKGVELRPQAQNPARESILAQGGDPDEAKHASAVANVLWVNNAGGALMLGDGEVTAVGATVNNPADVVANTVPILNADGTVSAVASAAGGGFGIKIDANGATVGTEVKGARYESFNNSSYDPTNNGTESRDSSAFPNSLDYIVTVASDANVITVDSTSVVNAVAAALGWPNFDPEAQLGTAQPGSLDRLVIELPPVSESTGRKLVIKDAKGYSNKQNKFPMIVVRASRADANNPEFIDDYSSFGDANDAQVPDAALLPEPFSSMTLLCDGDRWLII